MSDTQHESGSYLYRQMFADSVRKSDFKPFEESLHDSINGIAETAAHSVAINDAYGNSLSSVGTDDKVKSFSTYGFDNSTLNWTLWLALYNDSWVFRRAIDKPAQDEVNCGFILHGGADFKEVYRLYDQYKFDLIQLLQWGALFGGAVAVMLFDGISDEQMQHPITPKLLVGRRMKMYVTDRWYGVQASEETVTNMNDLDFGLPKYYNISFADGSMHRVHHSYVLRYEHRTAPKLIKCGQLQGWGYAEGSHILNELSRDDQLKSAITSLINKSLIEVVKMSGMRGVFMGADKGNEEQLTKRLEMVNWGRTYNSLTFLDKDDDYIMNQLSNISGLSQLLETNMWLVAASLDMQGVLFGDMKGGLSQESDAMHRYAQTIMVRCESYFRPVLQKLLVVLYTMAGVAERVDFEFRPLDQDEINDTKLSTLQNHANLMNTLLGMGIISKYQAAESMRSIMLDRNVSISFDDLELNKLKFEEEAEILAAYKTAGHDAPESILANQFPESEGNPLESLYQPQSAEKYEGTSDMQQALRQVEAEEAQQETVE